MVSKLRLKSRAIHNPTLCSFVVIREWGGSSDIAYVPNGLILDAYMKNTTICN